jgi:hypothetical protein
MAADVGAANKARVRADAPPLRRPSSGSLNPSGLICHEAREHSGGVVFALS